MVFDAQLRPRRLPLLDQTPGRGGNRAVIRRHDLEPRDGGDRLGVEPAEVSRDDLGHQVGMQLVAGDLDGATLLDLVE